jgi:hypothetical protein
MHFCIKSKEYVLIQGITREIIHQGLKLTFSQILESLCSSLSKNWLKWKATERSSESEYERDSWATRRRAGGSSCDLLPRGFRKPPHMIHSLSKIVQGCEAGRSAVPAENRRAQKVSGYLMHFVASPPGLPRSDVNEERGCKISRPAPFGVGAIAFLRKSDLCFDSEPSKVECEL